MTADERELMGQHGAFLEDLLQKGLIVAHGPVIDSTGGFGLSLYEVDDDRDMKATTSEDPAVKGGVGHYEIWPMLHLKTRG
jgi:uncharacterized protein YciI